MKKQTFSVTGMTCAACSARVEQAVSKLSGVEQVSVNLLTNSMTVTYDETAQNSGEICKAVEKAGYGAYEQERQKNGKSPRRQDPAETEQKHMKRRLILSAVFTIPLFYLSMGHMMGWPLPGIFLGEENALIFAFTQFLLLIPIVMVNRKYYQVGYKTLFHRAPNMDSLIALGSSAALVYGIFAIYQIGWGMGHADWQRVHHFSMDLYFESAGMILTLITLGKYMESRAKGKTSQAISKLMDLSPKTACVLRDGTEQITPIEQVQIGDLLVVRAGESIPADGVIQEGHASVDESALTGESMPYEKKAGDSVTGATVSRSGYFVMKATRVGDDTTFAQIIRLVEEASSSKAPIAKLADRISGIFVPVVIVIALVSMVVWLLLGKGLEFSLSMGISVLVISCPCALGLATPTAIMVGTGKGAENGILIKSAEALELLHKVDTVVLDKTGTVTQGKPAVTDLFPCEYEGEEFLLKTAASLEALSEHPLSVAIVQEGKDRGISLETAGNLVQIPGQGISGTVQGKTCLAGNRKMMEENHILLGDFSGIGEQLAKEGKTPLYFASEGKLIGIIGVADVVKPTSAQAVEQWKQMGIDVVMLTGDHPQTAAAIGEKVGIHHVIAQVLPQDKAGEVQRLQQEGHKIAMVGDGINDAPALAGADVGIAIGAGTDVAIESADVVLMKSDLMDAVTAVQLSRAVVRNIKQNLFWAFFYNSIGIPVAAGVFFGLWGLKLNPMLGAAAMSFSSVCVVSNALRLKCFRPKWTETSCPMPSQPEEKLLEQDILNISDEKDHKEENKMKKVLHVEGMMCAHCSARVEKVLSEVVGVASAQVDLEAKTATVVLEQPVEDSVLIQAVTDAGYEVTGVETV
ncbi:MAG: heavy metal translocating P-type ATPase [Massiliimalia sp.]|jgi:heavy metal translocating P-type ATPase